MNKTLVRNSSKTLTDLEKVVQNAQRILLARAPGADDLRAPVYDGTVLPQRHRRQTQLLQFEAAGFLRDRRLRYREGRGRQQRLLQLRQPLAGPAQIDRG